MGLACSNIRLLTLTARKADCEYNISIDAMKKMALAREQSELSRTYYSKLQAKQISYRADRKYNQMTYQYLMGYGSGSAILNENNPLKTDNSMILTSADGRVVMNSTFANALTKVLGSSCMDSNGRGDTFSADLIPELIAVMAGGSFNNPDAIRTVMNGGSVDDSYSATPTNLYNMETQGTTNHDSTNKMTAQFQKVIDFYYPIFHAASANGWTTEFTRSIEDNKNYISDALVSGTLQLVKTTDYGDYEPDTSLQYFITSGLVAERQDAQSREDLTVWYNAEKERISEQESYWDLEITDLSTELEAIKTEMESLKSMIEDGQKVFEWGS